MCWKGAWPSHLLPVASVGPRDYGHSCSSLVPLCCGWGAHKPDLPIWPLSFELWVLVCNYHGCKSVVCVLYALVLHRLSATTINWPLGMLSNIWSRVVQPYTCISWQCAWLASQETRYPSCSFARKGSPKKALGYDCLPSLKHPWTTLTPESRSFAILCIDLPFVPRHYKVPPLVQS